MLWAMVWLSPVHTLNRPDLLINVVSAFILVTSDMISGKLKRSNPILSINSSLASVNAGQPKTKWLTVSGGGGPCQPPPHAPHLSESAFLILCRYPFRGKWPQRSCRMRLACCLESEFSLVRNALKGKDPPNCDTLSFLGDSSHILAHFAFSSFI